MKKLAGLGFTAADVAEPELAVFPDNMQSLRVFIAMRTQWRYVCGMGGLVATGLDYSALPEVWERTETQESKRNAVFRDLTIMEAAALEIINKEH